MARLQQEFDSLGMEAMAHVALVLLREGGDAGKDLVDQAVEVWTSNLRVGGRTAYIAACEGCATPTSEHLLHGIAVCA